MCTGSCDKTMTAAMIRKLAREGKLDLNAGVFKLLNITPAGKVVDDRIWKITVNHLLEHKAGWQGKPLETADQAYLAQAGKGEAPGMDSIRSYECAWRGDDQKAVLGTRQQGAVRQLWLWNAQVHCHENRRTDLSRLSAAPVVAAAWDQGLEMGEAREGATGRATGAVERLHHGRPRRAGMDVSTGAMSRSCAITGPTVSRGAAISAAICFGGAGIIVRRGCSAGDGYNIALLFNGRKGSLTIAIDKELHQAIEWMQGEKSFEMTGGG